MSVNYDKIIQNLKKYLSNAFEGVKINENFDIDVIGFEKGYKKTNEEKIAEEISIDYIKKIKILHSETTFLYEKIIIFEYKKELYYVYSSKSKINFQISELQPFLKCEQELDLGMFLAFFREKETFLIINNMKSEDQIKDILELEGDIIYDFNKILELFDDLKVYKITEDYYEDLINKKNDFFNNFKYRIIGLIRCIEKEKNIYIENFFNKETINIYKEIFLDNRINNFPYENLYLSISQNHPKFCFLEIYRILEKLYPIIYCHHVIKGLEIKDKDLLSVNSIFSESVKFKPRERDAIQSIFKYAFECSSSKQIVKNIYNYRNCLDKIENNFKIKDEEFIKINKWIYKIRNSSVHLSFNNSNDVDINKILQNDILINYMLLLVKELYFNLFRD